MKKLFIGIPSYGFKCFTPFVESLLKLQQLIYNTNDIELEYKFIPQESLITRARNTLVSYFLRSDCTHMMFIDADIAFHPEDIIQLINHDKELIVGAYPHKTLVKKEGYSDQACFNYAINLLKNNVPIKDGIIEIAYGATGFMMIQRSVFESMIKEYPELQYINDIMVDNEYQKEYYALFDCIIDPESKRYLSEDFTFCKRWRDIGGKIYLDLSINLSHIGIKSYNGSFYKKIKECGIIA